MPKQLAAVLCFMFIGYLFYVDFRRPDRGSPALWVPTIWMFLIGSRHVSAWLNLRPEFDSAQDLAEGSPIDRAVFFGLIIAGILILARKKIDWERLLIKNGWLVLYLLYCLASVTWTDDPALLHETVGEGSGASDHGPCDPVGAEALRGARGACFGVWPL